MRTVPSPRNSFAAISRLVMPSAIDASDADVAGDADLAGEANVAGSDFEVEDVFGEEEEDDDYEDEDEDDEDEDE